MPLQDVIHNSSNIGEGELWTKMKSGNKDAFVRLYNQYADILLQYGYHLIKDKSMVEDTIHDIFVSVWDQKEKTADVHSVKFYLMSSLRRMLIRKIKKENILQVKAAKISDFTVMSPSFLDVNFEAQDKAALIKRVQNALDNLSARQKEIIYLKFYQNLSYQEISELLGLDQKYTYNLASRAYMSFKEQFGKFGFLILWISFSNL